MEYSMQAPHQFRPAAMVGQAFSLPRERSSPYPFSVVSRAPQVPSPFRHGHPLPRLCASSASLRLCG